MLIIRNRYSILSVAMPDVRRSGVIWWRPSSSRRNEWYKRRRAWKKQFAVGFVVGQGIERARTAEGLRQCEE
jgi:hypothetical protein